MYFEMKPILNTDIKGYDLPKSVHLAKTAKSNHQVNTLDKTVIRSRGNKKIN